MTEADVERVAKAIWDADEDGFLPLTLPGYQNRLARAAIAAIPPPADKWQPINVTPVPRDGTWFAICRKDEGFESYEVGRYEPLFCMEDEEIYQWHGFNNMHRATHWMPLPEPPK